MNGEWYRDALGGFGTTYHTGKDVELTVEPVPVRCRMWGMVRAACHHPDIAVRVGTRLGVIGVWMGLIGIAASIPELGEAIKIGKYAFVVGVATLSGIFGLVACRGPHR